MLHLLLATCQLTQPVDHLDTDVDQQLLCMFSQCLVAYFTLLRRSQGGLIWLRCLAYNVELKEEAEKQGFALISAGMNLALSSSDEDRAAAVSVIEDFRTNRCDRRMETGVREDVIEEERDMSAYVCQNANELLRGAGPPPDVLARMFSRRVATSMPAPAQIMAHLEGSSNTSSADSRPSDGGTEGRNTLAENTLPSSTSLEAPPVAVAPDGACAASDNTRMRDDYLSWADESPGANGAPGEEAPKAAVVSPKGQVRSIADVLATLDKPENQPRKIFPTLFSRVNFADYFGSDGLARLGDIANRRCDLLYCWHHV